MSPVTLYEVSLGQIEKILSVLIIILKEGTQSPKADSLPEARLWEDMKPLTYQIFIVTRTASQVIQELTGNKDVEFPEDNFKTMDDMIAAAEKWLAMVKAVDPDSINGKEDVPVVFATPNNGSWHLTGKSFVFNVCIPNSYFHLQTAYSIMRNNGVPLSKRHYLGPFAGPPTVPPAAPTS